jgi:muramoyltetrapeptide carboxypeptidase
MRSDILERHGYLAGDDTRRATELAQAMQDPEVSAIVCARGGYGLTRILDELPWDAFAQSPKWLVGFSDVTALHLEAQRRGLVSVHGPNVTGLSRAIPAERAQLLSILERHEGPSFGGLEVVHRGPGRTVTGPLVGGNLTLVETEAASGKLSLPEGAILFLEDVTERPYRVDRMLTSLARAGHLARVGAIVFGDFTECPPGPDGVTIEDVLRERTAGLGVLVLAGIGAGHGCRNMPLPLGFSASVSLDGSLSFPS